MADGDVSSGRKPGVPTLALFAGVLLLTVWLLYWAWAGFEFNLFTVSGTTDCQRALLPFSSQKSCTQLTERSGSSGVVTSGQTQLTATVHSFNLQNRTLTARIRLQGVQPGEQVVLVESTVPGLAGGESQTLASQRLPADLPVTEADVEVPMDGDPRQFPGDVYVADVALEVRPVDASDPSGGPPLPIRLTPTVDAGAADYAVFLRSQSNPGVASSQELHLVILRSGYQQVAVYAVLFVPMVLAVILLSTFWLRHPTASFATDFLFPLATFLVTLLPLRAVLVPPQVPGVTRIDYVLGYEALLLMFAGVLAYGLHLWDMSRQRGIYGR